jgi:hypothetical protein
VFKFKNITFSISLISNKGLTAAFFAKFIAIKIQQGQSIKQVIRPIIKDILKINSKGIKVSAKILNKSKAIFKNNFIKFKTFVIELASNKYKDLNT